VIPLTTSAKESPYHVALGLVGGRNAAAIISQLRLIDTRRLGEPIATLDKMTFESVRKAVKDML
jgi:mRNA-degrading endonuclease toxin of MazEF toxin-antitoxin module